jgi:hypothetical protein
LEKDYQPKFLSLQDSCGVSSHVGSRFRFSVCL